MRLPASGSEWSGLHGGRRPVRTRHRTSPAMTRCDPLNTNLLFQLHPAGLPQGVDLRHLPLPHQVKVLDSSEVSPGEPLALASARFSATGRASACAATRLCCSSCSVGESFCSASALSAAVPDTSARGSRPPANAFTLEDGAGRASA